MKKLKKKPGHLTRTKEEGKKLRYERMVNSLKGLEDMTRNIVLVHEKIHSTLIEISQVYNLPASVGDAVLLSLYNISCIKEGATEHDKQKLLMTAVVRAIYDYRKSVKDSPVRDIRDEMLDSIWDNGISIEWKNQDIVSTTHG